MVIMNNPKEHPILFAATSVRKIINLSKTQTRRVINPQPEKCYVNGWGIGRSNHPDEWCSWYGSEYENYKRWSEKAINNCPYGKNGDLLWVKEQSFLKSYGYDWFDIAYPANDSIIVYKRNPITQSNPYKVIKNLQQIFMPRWASRITLEINSVRVEPLQDISENDCCLELGVPMKWNGEGTEPYHRNMQTAFSTLWDSINAKRGYPFENNPWVWAIEFKLVSIRE